MPKGSLIENIASERETQRKEPAIRAELVQKLNALKQQGWSVAPLEAMLGGDIDALQKEFENYEKNMAEMWNLSKRLKVLDTRGFEPDARGIHSRLNDPYALTAVRREIDELEKRISGAAEQKKRKESTVIEEVFLIYSNGILIKHYTSRLKPYMDQDILSGMLTAVQSFVKDSFQDEAGALDELKYGELKIVMGRGKHLIVAAVLRGPATEGMRPQITSVIGEMESAHAELIASWDGQLEKMHVLDKYMKKLIDGSV
jgi:hypothetical protein